MPVKLYFFIANDDELKKRLECYNGYTVDYRKFLKISGNQYSVYAFTNKKSYRDKFIELHDMSMFSCITYDVTKEEYDALLHDNMIRKTCELKEIKYITNSKSAKIVSTEWEHEECCELWIDTMENSGDTVFSYIPFEVIDALQDKYIDALNKLGLNAMVVVLDEELSNILDNFPYVFDDDYVFRVEGNIGERDFLGRTVTANVLMKGKTLNAYIYLFKNIMAKND